MKTEANPNAEKVAFLNPPSLSVENDRLEPPLGQLYIAAATREAGYGNLIFEDMSGCKTEDEIGRKLKRIPDADIYAIGVFCTTHRNAKRMIARIREQRPGAYVIVGGPNPSALPEFTLADLGADVVVVGEAEDAVVDCLASFSDNTPVRGVVSGRLRRDIDSHAFPARDLCEPASYSRKLMGKCALSMIASRGCPHGCIHCNSTVMGAGARRTRFRSPRNIALEIDSLRGRWRYFRFNDDCFTEHPQLEQLSSFLASFDIQFRIFARVSHLTRRNCELLEKAGCVHVSVGLESMDPANLAIIGKGSQAGLERRVLNAKEHGIAVRSFFMVGLPFDSDSNIEKYFAEAAKLGFDEFTVYPLIPYPGTKIAQQPEAFGYRIVNRDFRDYVQIGIGGESCYALRHERFGPADVRRWKKRAEQILRSSGARDSKNSLVAK